MSKIKTAEKLLSETIKNHNEDCPIIYELNLDEKTKKKFINMMKKYAKQHVFKCIESINEKALKSNREQILNGVLVDAYQLDNII